MSKETTLRYEQPPKPNKLYQQYIKNLQANAVLIEEGHHQTVLDRKDLHDNWIVESDKKIRAKSYKNEKNQLGHELKMVSKANLLVRRRALALKLEADQRKYEEELALNGKSFHKQRI